jgi:hypothetical protein
MQGIDLTRRSRHSDESSGNQISEMLLGGAVWEVG